MVTAINNATKQKSRQGWTLIEVMAVLAIIAVVAALLFPVLSRARESANQTNCVSNLSQLYKILEIYRSDNNGVAFGTALDMGLPPFPLKEYAAFNCSAKKDNRVFPYIQLFQGYVGADPARTWVTFVTKNEGNTPLIVDVNHNSANIPQFSPYFKRLGLVLYLDGSVRKVERAGDIDGLSTWVKK